MTTRRAFLGAVAASMASMALPAVAQTLAQKQIAQHGFAFDRYQVALQKFDLIVEMNNEALAANPESKRGLSIEVATMMFDDLMAYLFAEFPDVASVTFAPELHDQCQILLNQSFKYGICANASVDDLLRMTPSPIIDALWPVALSKELMATHRLQVNTRASTTFSKFSTKYRDLVCGPKEHRVNRV